MSKKVFKTVASIATVAVAIAAAIPSGGTSLLAVGAAALGTSASVLTAGALALSLGSSLLFRPKAPSTSAASTDRLSASIDPRTPRKFVLGRTAMATDIRDQEFSDNQEQLHRFVVVASHKVAAIREIWLDEKLAWTASGGIQGEFVGYLGVEGYADGNPANAKNISPRMGNSRRYTGLAWVYLRFKLTGNSKKAESPFAQSVPSRVTIVGDGAFVYDPRLDSTVPGGSGPCRPNDQSTWIWSDNAGRNPALQLLWYLLGWRIQNPATGEWRLAVGKGIPASRIDLASFITAANLCDEPVILAAGGTQPRYRSDGCFSEGDATSVVLDQLKASMNAELDDVDGKIRITVLHNDLATPVADFSEDDVLSGFTWDQTAPLDETYNVVRGTFIDPAANSLYQAVDYPEVRIASPDGIDRIETVDFQTVQDDRQAQRLVKQRIARMLYSGRFSATFSYRAWKVQKNDVIRLTFAPLGWTNKLFRVVECAVQVDGQVPMVLQVENAAIYLWDRDERPAIQPVEPTSYDPYLNPIYQDVVDPKYGDGTSINDLRPAEPGATNGMNPDEAALLAQLDADTAQALLDIAAAEQTVIDMQEDVAGLGDAILAAEGEIDAIEAVQATQGASITTLQTTASTQAGEIASIETDLATANANISTNASAISGLSSSVSTLSSTVSTQGSSITSLQSAITTTNGNVATLQSTVSTQGASITTMQSALTALDSDVALLETTVRSGGNPNLLPNGGFEDGMAGWLGEGASFAVAGGTWGQQAATTSNVADGAFFWLRKVAKIDVAGGVTYTLSADLAVFGTGSIRSYLNIQWLNASNAVISESSGPIVSGNADFSTNGVNRIASKLTASAPTGATGAIVRLFTQKISGSVTYAGWRQVKFERGSVMTTSSNEASVTRSFASINGLFARWGVELDVNGYGSGFALNNNGARSDAIFDVDRFAVGKNVGGVNRVDFPFQIVGSTTYMQNAMIRDLSVERIKIANNAISTAPFASGSTTMPDTAAKTVATLTLTPLSPETKWLVVITGMAQVSNTSVSGTAITIRCDPVIPIGSGLRVSKLQGGLPFTMCGMVTGLSGPLTLTLTAQATNNPGGGDPHTVDIGRIVALQMEK